MRWSVGLRLTGSAASIAFGQATVSIDLVDPSDGITQPPAGILALDVLVEVPLTDSFMAAWITADVRNGTRFIYGESSDPNDPSTSYPTILSPGSHDRFVTFVSRPSDRDADLRFDESGAMLVPHCTFGAISIFNSVHFDTGWAVLPPWPPPSADGAILRVALDLRSSCGTSGTIVHAGESPPEGYQPLLLVYCGYGDTFGIAVMTADVAARWTAFGVAVDATQSCAGDVDRDDRVSIEDLAMLLSSFEAQVDSATFLSCADFDRNDSVDLADLADLLAQFGSDCP